MGGGGGGGSIHFLHFLHYTFVFFGYGVVNSVVKKVHLITLFYTKVHYFTLNYTFFSLIFSKSSLSYYFPFSFHIVSKGKTGVKPGLYPNSRKFSWFPGHFSQNFQVSLFRYSLNFLALGKWAISNVNLVISNQSIMLNLSLRDNIQSYSLEKNIATWSHIKLPPS